MPWWGWIVVGAVLLASEVVVATDFYLAVLGAAAIAVGVLVRFVPAIAAWQQWAAFAVAAAAALIASRRLWPRVRAGASPQEQLVVGERAVVLEEIPPGGRGRAEARGSVWAARNVGPTALHAGEEARITGTEGIALLLCAEPQPEGGD